MSYNREGNCHGMRAIGKYEVVDKIGGGSMGTVYRAQDSLLDRGVALKILRTAQGLDADLKKRFYREAAPCTRLQHPHIVAVYDVGEVEGAIHVAMELLAGMDLARKIQWPVAQKVGFMAQICDALDYAHQQYILHRDLKPTNLYLCQDYTAKVLDFGLARLSSAKKLITREIAGTPNYQSPEQILGSPSDSRADLFSAAVCFCEFLTGVHPFESIFVPRRIAETPPDSLRAVDPEIPESLEKLLFRALEKDARQRIQTAAEFAAGLRAVQQELGGQPALVETAAGGGLILTAEEAMNPAGEPDLSEWRVKEFTRLLSDFDESVALEHASSAQRVLDELANLARADARLSAAFADCESRLRRMGGARPQPAHSSAQATVMMPAVSVPPEALPPKPVEREAIPAAAKAEPASFKIGAAPKPPEAPPPPAPSPAARPLMPSASLTPAPPPGVAARTPPTPQSAVQSPATRPSKSGGKLLAIAAGVVVLVAGAIGVARLLRRNAPVEPSVARAVVQADSTGLMPQASASSAALFQLHRGDALHVLSVPRNRGQEWIQVQFVTPSKVSPPGYAQAADLGDWSSDEAGAALALLKAFGPSEVAPEAEINAQIQKLRDFAARFGGAPQAGEGHLEIARLYFALGRLRRIAGASQTEWQGPLEQAKASLEQAKGDVNVETMAGRMRQQLEMLVPPPAVAGGRAVAAPAPAAPAPLVPPPPAPAKVSLDQLLRQVSTAWNQGNYKRAMTLVDRVLAEDPEHAAAKRWKVRIREAQAEEQKLSQ